MLSNNFHSGEVAASACALGCPVVDHAMKPAPFSVWVAAGVRTVLVRPQSRRDLWYTQIFRLGEALVLRGVEFEGEASGAAGRGDGC